MLRNIPEEHRSQLLKAHMLCHLFTACKSVQCLYSHYTNLSVTVRSPEALDIRNTFCQDVIGLIVSLPYRRGSDVFVTVSASKKLCY